MLLLQLLLPACTPVLESHIFVSPREDGAVLLPIELEGSLQNPAWSPDGQSILLTRFQNGYNREPADLLVVDLEGNIERILVSDGSGNINLPGSSWNGLTGQIAFSSSREPHDEIFLIPEIGETGDELRITTRPELAAYEPALSPDGRWVIFESHPVDVEAEGSIVKVAVDGTSPFLTLSEPGMDSRQPDWAPTGGWIVYQVFEQGEWDLWLMDAEGAGHRCLTQEGGDQTDPSFSPDGRWVVYSSEVLGEDEANLFILPVEGGVPIRVTRFEGYDGAPAWSLDGGRILFESYPGDPTLSTGTRIWLIDAPVK